MMRQRDIIYLKENEFFITGATIWMSEWELAELFYATRGEIRAAINRVLKDSTMPACHSTRYMPLENGRAAEVYSLEAIIAILRPLQNSSYNLSFLNLFCTFIV